MAFNPAAGPELAPIPPGMNELFTCPAYNVKLSRWSCGRRFIAANAQGADRGVLDRMQFCVKCEVGELHEKNKAAPDVLIQNVVRVKSSPKEVPAPPVDVKKEPDVTIAKRYMYEGEMRTLPEIAKIKGMETSALYVRVGRWGAEKALAMPYGGRNGAKARPGNDVQPEAGPEGGTYKRPDRVAKPPKYPPLEATYLFQGEQRTPKYIAAELKLSLEALKIRIRKWGVERALATPRHKHVRQAQLLADHAKSKLSAATDEAVQADPPKPKETVDEVRKRVAPKARRERAGEVGGKLELPPEELLIDTTGGKAKLTIGGVACELLEAAGIGVKTMVETGDGFAIFIVKKQ